MIVISSHYAENLFLDGLMVCKKGMQIAPRGLHTLECRDSVTFELLSSDCNVVTNPYRRLNYTFGLFESIAMWNGINDVDTFRFYNKEMEKFSDDGTTFFGSYGAEFTAQIPRVIELLTRDRDSRQAVITIWRRNPPASKDIPCTVMLHFMVRDFHLNLNVYMRSNDIWLGFPYDITNFSRIQQALASLLQVKVGVLRHTVGSLHMYAGDIYKAENAFRYHGDARVAFPKCTAADLVLLDETARSIREGKEWLIPTSEFGTMHADLLASHKQLKLKQKPCYGEPYKSIIDRAKEVHGYFTDSKN